MIYLPQKLQKALTFFKLPQGWQMLERRLTLKRSRTAMQNVEMCYTSEDEDDIADEVFNALFNELTDSECDMTAEEYVDFDVETCSSLPAINSD